MWDPVEEKTAMYVRAGDFYYGKLREEDSSIARMLAHLHAQCRVLRQACNIQEALTAEGYFNDNYKLISFTDEDIDWHGMKTPLQKQYVKLSRKKSIVLENAALLEEERNDKKPAAEANNLIAEAADKIELPEYAQLIFSLHIDKDIMVTSIRLDTGRILYANQDFQTEFGRLTFYENPISLFPRMKFMAKSYTYRARNLYCFPLSVDVYGPVDRIIHYYKVSQTPRALYLASAQAAGLPVIRKECVIQDVAPLGYGVTYFTSDGRYDADFPHTHLAIGTKLPEEYVIGGEELYRLIGPYDPLPTNITAIELDYALPVKGLKAPARTIQISDAAGKFRPMYSGSQEVLDAYWQYLQTWEALKPGEDTLPATANGLKFFRDELCANRCIIVQINRSHMLRDMQLKLLAFLQRELPLGSVLTVAELVATISENKVGDV